MHLCQKLKLSIEKLSDPMGDEQVKITLEDSLNLTRVDICYPINVTTPQSHRYHIKEAIVLAMRQVVDQAVAEGMINLKLKTVSSFPGARTTLNIPVTLPGELPVTGSTTELDV